MKHIFGFDNIDCANCAAKIERALQKEDIFEEVLINFMLKKIEVTTQENEDSTRRYIEKIANKIENGVTITSYKKNKKQVVIQQQCGCGHKHDEEEHHHEHEHYEEHEHHHHEHEHHDEEEHHHEHEHHDEEEQHHRHEHHHEGCCSEHRECPIDSGIEQQKTSTWQKFKEKYLSHNKLALVRVIVSIVLLIVCRQVGYTWLYACTYLFIGYDVLLKAIKNIVKGKIFDENFLMALATVAAFMIKEYPEAIAVMIFYQIGEYFQHLAVDSSRKAIVELMDIRPEFARVLRGSEQVVDPREVEINEIIEVRPGEKIPLDGMVIKGKTYLDTSMLTGESVPQSIIEGMEALSGSINKDSVIEIRVTKEFADCTVSKIVDLIENASSKKSVAENLITKFAAVYTPTVVIAALLVAIIPSLITGNWNQWIYNSISFLVISCPCALVVSIPLSFFGGIGAASRQGILIKGGNYLEKLNEIDTVVLDKTGTITEGKFGVSALIPAKGHSERELLDYACQIEAYSNHPIAKSITSYSGVQNKVEVENYKEIPGYGLSATIQSKVVLAGNFNLMKKNNITAREVKQIGTQIYVAVEGHYLGCIVVADKVKKDSKTAIAKMKSNGIRQVIMLTGDKKEVAEAIAKEVGVDRVYAGLLPQDKVTKVEELIKEGRKVAFIGDGINDAPVLARADLGIAMGGVGSDAAVEASDMVLMTDELSCVNKALSIAKKTRTVVTQNIVLAIGVKLIVMVLALMSIANMWLAVFADVGVSLIAVLNATRMLSGNKKIK